MTQMSPRSEPTRLPVRALNTPTDQLSIQTLGQIFARSGYFSDAKSEAQAIVKILYGREMGLPPVAAMMGIHVISGKPVASANLLASCIRASQRYDYRVNRLDNQACELEFFDSGKPAGISSFTMEDAEVAGVLTGPNRATWTKFGRNMLFARALSNGARWYCPDVGGGAPVYVPEEMGAAVDGEGNVVEGTYTPIREQDPAAAVVDDEDYGAAWDEWCVVEREATRLHIPHKTLHEGAPLVKVNKWIELLTEKIEAVQADAPTVENGAGDQVNTATGEVLSEALLRAGPGPEAG